MSRKSLVPDAVRAEIARRYDGTSEVISALCGEFGLLRHNVHRIAKAAGYRTTKQRKAWDEKENEYLRQHWHRSSPDTIATHLGRSVQSVVLQKKRIGIGRYDGDDLTIHDLEAATKVDHRQWHEFIERGWLKAWAKPRLNGATPITRVTINHLKTFLTDHPEVINFATAGSYLRALLEVHTLPEPPRYKLVSCQSDSWQSGAKATPVGAKFHHGTVTLEDRHHEYSLDSCATVGGTDFWQPIHEVSPCCPRCGCKVSRYSERAVYRDDTPDEGETVAIIAAKIGLKWSEGAFRNEDGEAITQDQLLSYVFSSKRSPGKAVRVFQRLLEKGMSVISNNPVDPTRLLPNLLSYDLHEHQKETFANFLSSGALAVGWWPGWGKCFFGAIALTRLAGQHIVFAHNGTVLETWLAHLQRYAPRVEIHKEWKPARTRVRVFDADNSLRCTIHFFSYMTRYAFENDAYVLAIYDESQWLPGNSSHRKALINCEYRIGLSASPYREDGRADLIGMLTGQTVGEDWNEGIEDGLLKSVPVQVWLVGSLEHKHAMLAKLLLDDKRTLIFSESIEDGQTIAARNGVPFIYSATKDRLDVVRDNKVICMSRVGDCGLDIPDLTRVVEFSFHGGSRAQSMQRYGRLLHSREESEHVVLMTHQEHERFGKRLRVLSKKGFQITVAAAPLMTVAKVAVVAPRPFHSLSMAGLLGIVPAPVIQQLPPKARAKQRKLLAA